MKYFFGKVRMIEQIAKQKFGPSQQIKLIQKTQLNHDSYLFRFQTDNQIDKSQYKPGSHFVINGLKGQDENMKKKYTPIEPFGNSNYFDALIKIYRPNENPKFPQGGELTPRLENLQLGEEILVTGPLISIFYEGQGKFNIQRFKQEVDKDTTQVIKPNHILFLAGGTGIAPIYSMIQEMIREGNTSTKVTLLYGNKSIDDILLKKELDSFAQQNTNLQIVYTVDSIKKNEQWNGEVGIINKYMIQKYANDPKNPENYIMICGNTEMNKSCLKIVKELGFDPYHYFRF
ncbi:hypothetical protein ABPG74_005412 [Tetrahymena malaccensis]